MKEEGFPPEKKGSWTRKEQRQGEADNPMDKEADSDDEDMPTLIQEEESEWEEGDWTDTDGDESEAEYGRQVKN